MTSIWYDRNMQTLRIAHYPTMSDIPKPPVLPAPKSLGSGKDFQCEEHEVLLRAMWKKLDCGLEKLFGWKGARMREESKASIAGFGSQLESVASLLGSMAERCGEPEMATWLRATQERVATSLVCNDIGAWQKDIASVEIGKRELAKELTEERNARTSRAHSEVVGYVDCAVELLVPVRLRLRGNLPPWVVRENDDQQLWRDPLKVIRQEPAKMEELRTLTATAPVWVCKKEPRRVWIDVRVHTVALGQLLREVKVLQELSDHKAKLILVLPGVDNEMSAMLANEGVLVTTHDWWKKL